MTRKLVTTTSTSREVDQKYPLHKPRRPAAIPLLRDDNDDDDDLEVIDNKDEGQKL